MLTNNATFSDVTQIAIEDKRLRGAANTIRADMSRYRNMQAHFGDWLICDIHRSDLDNYFQGLMRTRCNKTVTEYLCLMKDIFKRAVDEGIIEKSPAENIKAPKKGKTEPEPYTRDEIRCMYEMKSGCETTRNAALADIFTGLRVSELLAASWENVDFQRKILKVTISYEREGFKRPKTEGSVRDIDLNEHAIAVLREQYAITGQNKPRLLKINLEGSKKIRREKHRLIFLNPENGKGFTTKQFREKFFIPFIKQCGLRYRPPMNLRQTYTSQSLMAGLDKHYVARQLGHTTTAMIDRYYYKWIPEDAKNYRADFDKHLSDISSPPRRYKTPWYRHKRPIGTLLVRLSCAPRAISP